MTSDAREPRIILRKAWYDESIYRNSLLKFQMVFLQGCLLIACVARQEMSQGV